MSLKRDVGFGLFWVSFATLASRGLSLLRQLILARSVGAGRLWLGGLCLASHRRL